MKYYKYPITYSLEGETATVYIEVKNTEVVRQLDVLADRFVSSNVDLEMADRPFEYEDISDADWEGLEEISEDEFVAVWQEHLNQNSAKWIEAKKLFPINKSVIGCMRIFFPQGIIVQLAPKTFGVTDYRQARATTSPEFMYSGIQLAGVVTGYDETNQWIELSSPQIREERCDIENWQSPT